MTSTSDLAASLRRIKPEKRLGALSPRPEAELVSAADLSGASDAGNVIVFDTTVYIAYLTDTLSDAARALVGRCVTRHCSVCVSELGTGLANASPKHRDWRDLRRQVADLLGTIPRFHILTPDHQVWLEAGLIAGTLARTQGFQRSERKECLNDALIYLTAAKAGYPVLTSNRADFDLIQQLAPHGRFVHY